MKHPRLAACVAGSAVVVLAGASAYAGAELHPRVVIVRAAECHNPTLPSGDSIDVDASGNASAPAQPKSSDRQFVCTDGTWVHISGYGA